MILVKRPDVNFEEVNHVYTNLITQETYTSVTQLLKKFSIPFPADKIATALAKKQKRKKEDILEEWKQKAKSTAAKGTRIHELIQNELNGSGETSEDLTDVISAISSEFLLNAKEFAAELIVADDKYMVAGSIDLTSLRPVNFFSEDKRPVVDILDHKTWETLQADSGAGKNYLKYMIGPVSHLEDCNFNKAVLQVSIYGVLIERNYNVQIGRLAINWIKERICEDLTIRYESVIIPVPYMRTEALAILNHEFKPLPFDDEILINPEDDF